MIGMSGVATGLGFFTVYLLGTIITWRKIALICFGWPIATMVAISFVILICTTYISLHFETLQCCLCSEDSRDSYLAVVKKTRRQSARFTAVAPWLGVTKSGGNRVQ